MMKKTISTLLLIWMAVTCFAQEGTFTLRGQIEHHDYDYVYLSYEDSQGIAVRDSCLIRDGRFVFSGTVSLPTQAALTGAVKSRRTDDPNFVYLFLEPTSMEVRLKAGAFSQFSMTGSTTQDESSALDVLRDPIRYTLKALVRTYQQANREYQQSLKDSLPAVEQEILQQISSQILAEHRKHVVRLYQLDYDFITSHPDSYLSAYLLRQRMSPLTLEKRILYFDPLTDRIKQSKYGRVIGEDIAQLQQGSPGATAFLFAAQDIDDHLLSLADFRGQYVLLDFWGSWCIPCRQGNPHLRSLYQQYKSRGLEIVGIADDDKNPDAWRKAVAQDSIGVWRHVLSGFRKESGTSGQAVDIATSYGVTLLPTKILVDPRGIIIGRYVGGGQADAELDKKLAEIFP